MTVQAQEERTRRWASREFDEKLERMQVEYGETFTPEIVCLLQDFFFHGVGFGQSAAEHARERTTEDGKPA